MSNRLKLKIFIIEDEGTLRSRYSKMVSDLGYDCRASSGLAEPVKELFQYQPHLALIDTKLPGTTGWCICEELRKTEYGKQMGIIGMSTDHYQEEWEQAGADLFLDKINLFGTDASTVLDAAIGKVLEKYRK